MMMMMMMMMMITTETTKPSRHSTSYSRQESDMYINVLIPIDNNIVKREAEKLLKCEYPLI
jgi:hypothetical protein